MGKYVRIVYVRLAAERRIGYDDVERVLLDLLSCRFVLPLTRRGERVPLVHVSGTIAVHDEVHLRRADEERVYVHAEQIALRQFLNADSHAIVDFLFGTAFGLLETDYLFSQNIDKRH